MRFLSWFIVLFHLFSFFLSGCSAAGSDYGLVRVYDASEVTAEVLENRNGAVIIERVFGVVTDAETGDGVILNPEDEDYAYINYLDCGCPISDGMRFLTFFVYDPGDNEVDTILYRIDIPLERE